MSNNLASNSEAAQLLERIGAELRSLGDREARAARHLLANFPLAGLATVADFAAQSGVSTATVLRLVKRLGYPVYAQFQAALMEDLEVRLQSPLTRIEAEKRGEGDYLDDYFQTLSAHLEQIRQTLNRPNFETIAELLADHRKDIHIIGGRYTGNIGNYLADLMLTLRPKVRMIRNQSGLGAHHLVDLSKNSILIVFDVRRYQQDLADFAELAQAQGATVILFTDPWLSPVAKFSRHVITFPVTSPSIFDVISAGSAVVEALLGLVAQKCGEAGHARIATLEALNSGQAPIKNKQNRGTRTNAARRSGDDMHE